ncbi:restriction endonuclease subunit S [Staphylococcus capitis]|uniref:restriction endonuclease subunit S n=1 Tax=Staphylococcus capitis TaxID=29388 RepID=UPI0021A71BCC|nr:restriction endonuclease subunit S [Staphylococcus capitis]MCT2013745.1 restriction endonuclease subunit S [Staphylococcus capitis]
MNNIDLSSWKEFEIEKLFTIKPTKHHNLNNRQLFDDDGGNPVVVNSAYNNGVGGFTNKNVTENGNIITFSDTTDANSIFYQADCFVGYSHVQGMYPKFSDTDPLVLRFIAVVFKQKALTQGFNYGNKFNRRVANKLKIKLPIKDSDLDYEYMKSYMTEIDGIAKLKVNQMLELIGE